MHHGLRVLAGARFATSLPPTFSLLNSINPIRYIYVYSIYIYIYSNFEIVRIGELKEIFNSNQFVHFRIEPRRGSSLRFLLILDERERERDRCGFYDFTPASNSKPVGSRRNVPIDWRRVAGYARVPRDISKGVCEGRRRETKQGRVE